MTEQDEQRIQNALAWFQQFKKDHPDIIDKLNKFAKQNEPSEGESSILFNAVFNACFSALMFDEMGNGDHQKGRENDRRYIEDRDDAVKNLDAVIKFMNRHGERDTSLLKSAMFVIASNAKKQISILSELKEALTYEVKCFKIPHSHQHGCFLYPDPVHTDRTTTTPRMLAVKLVGLFRLYTSGESSAIRQPGWLMPVAGKPNHALVNEIVQATFPYSEADARSAEYDFKKNSPGIKIIPWEPWGK